jgi:hypothetical protein
MDQDIALAYELAEEFPTQQKKFEFNTNLNFEKDENLFCKEISQNFLIFSFQKFSRCIMRLYRLQAPHMHANLRYLRW